MDPSKSAPVPEAKLHFLDYWRIIRIRKTVILAVFLLVVITATLVTFILPESFSSKARIRVERDQSDIANIAAPSMFQGYDPYFIQTEFEVIQSDLILGKVIENLNLNVEWGKKFANGDVLKTTETMQIFKGRLDLRPVRNTSLIEIVVYSDKPEEAARLANAIAETYRNHRLDERQRLSLGGIKSLEERFAEQETKIRQAQQEVDDLRLKLKIPDAIANENAPTMLMTAETLRRIEANRIEKTGELVSQETLLKRLKELSPEQLTQALPNTVQDSGITMLVSLLENKTLAEQRLVSLRKEYGPDHSEVQKISSQVEDLNKKISERV